MQHKPLSQTQAPRQTPLQRYDFWYLALAPGPGTISTNLRLLEPAEPTSKLLRLASSVIRNQQRSVVLNQRLLQQVLGVLIDELLVVGNNGLGDGLTDGVDLRCVSTTGDSDADIDVGEFLETDDQEGFVDLESKDLRLDEVERFSIDLDEALSRLFFLSVFHPLRSPGERARELERRSSRRPGQNYLIKEKSVTCLAMRNCGCGLLLAEALNGLC